MLRTLLLLAMTVALLPGSAWASLLAEFTQQVVSERTTESDDDGEAVPLPLRLRFPGGVSTGAMVLRSTRNDAVQRPPPYLMEAGLSWNFQMLVVSFSDEFVAGLGTIGDLVDPLAEYPYPYRRFEAGDEVMGGTHPDNTPDYDGDGEIWSRYGSTFARRSLLAANLFGGGLEITMEQPSTVFDSFAPRVGSARLSFAGVEDARAGGERVFRLEEEDYESLLLPLAEPQVTLDSSPGTGQGVSVAAVPEPGTGVLVAACLAAFGWLRRRRAIG